MGPHLVGGVVIGDMDDDGAVSADVERQELAELSQLEIAPAFVVEDKTRDGDSKWETGLVPASVRAEVLGRDGGACRFCGGYVEHPALHHVIYRSQGGLNRPDNLISLHWMYEPRCHERIHSNKNRWQALGLLVVHNPGVTMLQLERWSRTRKRTTR